MTIQESRLSALDVSRQASDVCLLSSAQKYDIPVEYGTKVTGSGTVVHVPLQEGVRSAVTSASGDRAAHRTNAYFHADSIRCMQALYHSNAGQANQTRRWGPFDDEDGVYFELDDTTVAVGYRSFVTGSAVDLNIVQAAWNIDAMMGTGPSGAVLDLTKSNIYEISIHRATGRARFFINGQHVHTLEKRNVVAVPFMRSVRLPVGVDVSTDGASAGGSVTCLYQGVWDESGQPPDSVGFGLSGTASITTGGEPIFSIRPKATFNSITNRSLVVPRQLSAALSRIGCVRLVLNGTLTGESWVDVDATYSGAEKDISATGVSGGIVVGEYRMPDATYSIPPQILDNIFSRNGRKLSLKAWPASDADILTVVGIADVGTGTGYASLNWEEIR